MYTKSICLSRKIAPTTHQNNDSYNRFYPIFTKKQIKSIIPRLSFSTIWALSWRNHNQKGDLSTKTAFPWRNATRNPELSTKPLYSWTVLHPFYPTNAPSPPPESGVAADGAGAGDVVGLDVFLEHGHAAVARHQADVEHIHACKVH